MGAGKVKSKGKYFGIGLAVGVLVGIVVGLSISDIAIDVDPSAVPPEKPTAQRETESRDDAGASAIIPAPNEYSDVVSAESFATPTVEAQSTDSATSPSDLDALSTARTPIPISEAHADFIYSQSVTDPSDGRTRPAREVLEAEEKDEGWSYFTEQALRLFISGHAEAKKFSIFHIECRSSMCEIQAVGFNDSTAPDWSRVLYDLEQQPWYDFGQVGTSFNDYQGQLAILTRLYRQTSAPDGE